MKTLKVEQKNKLVEATAGWAYLQKNNVLAIDPKRFGEVIGFEYDTYKTGNICEAYLDGERISNNKAGGYLFGIKGIEGIDLDTMQIRTYGIHAATEWAAEKLQAIVDDIIGEPEFVEVEEEDDGFPPLEGSQKQVRWAKDLRAEAIDKISKAIEDAKTRGLPTAELEVGIDAAHVITSAKYYIDHRFGLAAKLVNYYEAEA